MGTLSFVPQNQIQIEPIKKKKKIPIRYFGAVWMQALGERNNMNFGLEKSEYVLYILYDQFYSMFTSSAEKVSDTVWKELLHTAKSSIAVMTP